MPKLTKLKKASEILRSCGTTVETRFNDGPRDCENMFVI